MPGGHAVISADIPIGKNNPLGTVVPVPLDSITKPTKLTLTVSSLNRFRTTGTSGSIPTGE